MGWTWLADLVLLLHAAIALFVLLGLPLILLGNLRQPRWAWVNRWHFRAAHGLAIAIVVGESWLDISCPLTTLEDGLRQQAGASPDGYGAQGFIAHWVQRLLFYRAPAWVFVLAYSGFALAVLAAWWYFPPRRDDAHEHPAASASASSSGRPAAMTKHKTTLHFAITIQAPRERVWTTMLDQPSYQRWTTPFSEGSRYEGSWAQGAEIRFIAPGQGGMVARIAANRAPEFISIEHLGMIDAQGVIDRDSEAVRAWTPAYENYTLVSLSAHSTEVKVSIEVAPDWLAMMNEMWPQALAALKAICEEEPAAGP